MSPASTDSVSPASTDSPVINLTSSIEDGVSIGRSSDTIDLTYSPDSPSVASRIDDTDFLHCSTVAGQERCPHVNATTLRDIRLQSNYLMISHSILEDVTLNDS